MSRVRFVDVAFAHPGGAPIFHRVSLTFERGWTAVAGPNGAGKTTLLRLLAGELDPTRGHVRLEPSDARVALCRQVAEAPVPDVRRLGAAWDAGATRLRARLGLDPRSLEGWATLSPGERQRWQIAAASWGEPDVLLLDEPTNHLDAQARALLAELASDHRGIGVVVAHDRAFLDGLADRVVWVDGADAVAHPGTYSEVRGRMQAEHRRAVDLRRDRKKDAQRANAELEARRARARSADRGIGARARMKGPKDHDARSAGAKARARNAAAACSAAVARLATRAATIDDALARTRVADELGRALFVGYEAAPGTVLTRVTLPRLGHGSLTLLEPTSIVIGREDRIRVAGLNGAGKTTLLRAIVDRWHLPPERVLTLPQEIGPDRAHAALRSLHELAPEARGRVLGIVAALGVEPERLLRTSEPSPGEAKKLILADGLARGVWCAVLDEPTNHLDVPSIERLELALARAPCALLLVTHDERLAEATTDRTWRISAGRLEVE